MNFLLVFLWAALALCSFAALVFLWLMRSAGDGDKVRSALAALAERPLSTEDVQRAVRLIQLGPPPASQALADISRTAVSNSIDLVKAIKERRPDLSEDSDFIRSRLDLAISLSRAPQRARSRRHVLRAEWTHLLLDIRSAQMRLLAKTGANGSSGVGPPQT